MDIGTLTSSRDQPDAGISSPSADCNEAAFPTDGFIASLRIISDEDVRSIHTRLMRWFAEQVDRREGMLFDFTGADQDGDWPTLPQLLDPRNFAPELIKTEFFHNADQLRNSFWDRRLVSLRAMRC